MIFMGLVREYDVVRGLLALIPGVREQSPYPYTQTHTHVTARLQAPQLSISTQIRQTLHPRTKYVTHHARARTHIRVCTNTHTCGLAETYSDRKAYRHHRKRAHTNTHKRARIRTYRSAFTELAGCLSC